MSNDQNLGEVTYTRTYDAPRDLVFECMITPEHLTHFWGPVGVSTPLGNIKVDPRPGGVFETIMVNDATGEEYPSRGVFVEVTKPEKIVWTEPDVEGGMTTTSHVPRPRRRPHRGRRPPDQRARDVPHSGLAGRDAEQLRPLRRLPGDAEVSSSQRGPRRQRGPAPVGPRGAAHTLLPMTRRARHRGGRARGRVRRRDDYARVRRGPRDGSGASGAKGNFARAVGIGDGRRIYVTCRGTAVEGRSNDHPGVGLPRLVRRLDPGRRPESAEAGGRPGGLPRAGGVAPRVCVRPTGHDPLRRGHTPDATQARR